jgi:hypothetical protein
MKQISTKRWVAYLGNIQVTSVQAESEEQAKERVDEELSAPLCRLIRLAWKTNGSVVKPLS